MTLEIIPEVSVLEPHEPEDSCSYCVMVDGTPVRKAKHSRSVTYKIDDRHKVAFQFQLCELCQYARRIFPVFDARMQTFRMAATIQRLNDRYAS